MRARMIAVMMLAGSLGSGVAMAGTGTDLIEECRAAVRAIDSRAVEDMTLPAGVCIGKVSMATQLLDLLHTESPKDYAICFPMGVPDLAQSVRVVKQSLEDSPAKNLQLSDTILIYGAMAAKYPCK